MNDAVSVDAAVATGGSVVARPRPRVTSPSRPAPPGRRDRSRPGGTSRAPGACRDVRPAVPGVSGRDGAVDRAGAALAAGGGGVAGDARRAVLERGAGARARRARLIPAWARLAEGFGVPLPAPAPAREEVRDGQA